MRKILSLVGLMLVASFTLTSCGDDEDEVLPSTENEGNDNDSIPSVSTDSIPSVGTDSIPSVSTDSIPSVSTDSIPQLCDSLYATVAYNPSRLAVAGNTLYVNGYGGNYDTGYTYALQIIDPATFGVQTIGKATHIAAYGKTLYTALCTSPDWVNYTTTFTKYEGAEEKGAFLADAPAEMASSIVYMLEVNPSNGDIYISTTDYWSDSPVYHFDADGRYVETITGCGPSVNTAVFDGESVYFLTEGLYSQNNSSVYRMKKGSGRAEEIYSAANNGKVLGDTGQDMVMHNGALYVVVHGSKYIAKLDKEGKELARYACSEEDGQPRYAAGYGDALYVTTYAGKVLKFDTNLQKVAEKAVGLNPEEICVYGGRLCVACCGWGYDNRVFFLEAF